MDHKYNVTQPAFTARINLNGIKLNSNKLAQVQRRFEQLTEHYQGDTLSLDKFTVRRDNGQIFHSLDFKVKDKSAAYVVHVKDFKDWFNKESTDEIAKTLTRIFKLGKFHETSRTRIGAIQSNLKRALGNKAINEIKAESTGSVQYSVLANLNAKRAKTLENELAKVRSYSNDVEAKITDSSLSLPEEFYWEN